MSNKYLGVYSTVEASNTPDKRSSYNYGRSSHSIRKRYWYAWEWDTGTVLVLSADENYKPTGQPRILVYAVFDSRFTLEEFKTKTLPAPEIPSMGQQTVEISAPNKPSRSMEAGQAAASNRLQPDSDAGVMPLGPENLAEPAPAEIKTQKPAAPSEPVAFTHRAASPAFSDLPVAGAQKRVSYSLEEIKQAERDVAASFQDGLRLFNNGDREGALFEFEWPLLVKAPWQRKHKHMFSNFGVTLRKMKEGELAVRFHQKALSLSPGEPGIMFNLARAYLLLGNMSAAKNYIDSVLDRQPSLRVGLLLRDYIEKNK